MNPPRRPRFLLAPDLWLKHAASDLKLGNLGRDQDVLPEQLCFHAQQATEKALKAVLVARGMEFPLTHDLEALLEILREAGVTLPQTMDDIDELTPYAVETRYPGVWEPITLSDVDRAFRLAEAALAWAVEMIRS